jgi:hypothetical protein
VHAVARISAAQVSKARTGHVTVRMVWVLNRGQQPFLVQQLLVIESGIIDPLLDHGCKARLSLIASIARSYVEVQFRNGLTLPSGSSRPTHGPFS